MTKLGPAAKAGIGIAGIGGIVAIIYFFLRRDENDPGDIRNYGTLYEGGGKKHSKTKKGIMKNTKKTKKHKK